ncbi:MAG: hypothetical protein JWN74_2076 [Acidobacteriaceae bacterium]|nr:hypothetical protein [Acidobacteriaceae bacterium]
MEWQHCIACCGVAATQSTAYAARAIVSAATIPGLANRIPIRLEGRGLLSQATSMANVRSPHEILPTLRYMGCCWLL